ncbi:hypothetical protein FOA52_005346 [Chlamydomonas sp. UWO 241]|nr:hypothetical protein FOA52_005346 [Chlamydomonas sp. UWO 241]
MARSRKAPKAPSRRPVHFWRPFNDWWRQELQVAEKRPSAEDINTWYHANAEAVWADVKAPTMAETRVHAKCLRTVDQVRDYFRKYREVTRDKQGRRSGASTGDDDDDEEDDGPPEEEGDAEMTEQQAHGGGDDHDVCPQHPPLQRSTSACALPRLLGAEMAAGAAVAVAAAAAESGGSPPGELWPGLGRAGASIRHELSLSAWQAQELTDEVDVAAKRLRTGGRSGSGAGGSGGWQERDQALPLQPLQQQPQLALQMHGLGAQLSPRAAVSPHAAALGFLSAPAALAPCILRQQALTTHRHAGAATAAAQQRPPNPGSRASASQQRTAGQVATGAPSPRPPRPPRPSAAPMPTPMPAPAPPLNGHHTALFARPAGAPHAREVSALRPPVSLSARGLADVSRQVMARTAAAAAAAAAGGSAGGFAGAVGFAGAAHNAAIAAAPPSAAHAAPVDMMLSIAAIRVRAAPQPARPQPAATFTLPAPAPICAHSSARAASLLSPTRSLGGRPTLHGARTGGGGFEAAPGGGSSVRGSDARTLLSCVSPGPLGLMMSPRVVGGIGIGGLGGGGGGGIAFSDVGVDALDFAALLEGVGACGTPPGSMLQCSLLLGSPSGVLLSGGGHGHGHHSGHGHEHGHYHHSHHAGHHHLASPRFGDNDASPARDQQLRPRGAHSPAGASGGAAPGARTAADRFAAVKLELGLEAACHLPAESGADTMEYSRGGGGGRGGGSEEPPGSSGCSWPTHLLGSPSGAARFAHHMPGPLFAFHGGGGGALAPLSINATPKWAGGGGGGDGGLRCPGASPTKGSSALRGRGHAPAQGGGGYGGGATVPVRALGG